VCRSKRCDRVILAYVLTELLFYQDPYLAEFGAVVVDVRPAASAAPGRERTGEKAAKGRKQGKQSKQATPRAEVALDRTAFYPEGGGQPADHGFLGGFPVLHTWKEDGQVWHVIDAEPDRAPPPGTHVDGGISWDRRFDYMQQHAGQHVLSAALMQIGEYATVSVHQGGEYTTIEINAEDIAWHTLSRIERRANRVITENRPVRTFWAEESELPALALRREPAVGGTLRIVEIEAFDRVACGGVHTGRTGEVGLVHCIRQERIRGRVRLYWKIGDRAYADYRLKSEIAAELTDRLSVPAGDITGAVADLEQRVKRAEYTAEQQRERLAAAYAERVNERARQCGPVRVGVIYLSEAAKRIPRVVAERCVEAYSDLVCCVINRSDGTIQWVVAAPPESGFSFERLKQEALPLVHAKGGGKPPILQGAVGKPEALGEFEAALCKIAAEVTVHL